VAKYEIMALKAAARGAWSAIADRVGGISDDYITTQHGPCPKCGGNDRWRVFGDFDATGGAICNQCGKMGDGIALIQWATGKTFLETVESIGDFLGMQPAGAKTKPGKTAAKTDAPRMKPATVEPKPAENESPAAESRQGELRDPLRNVEFIEWNPGLVAFWCLKKKLRPEALPSSARMARYRKRYTCLAIPAFSGNGDEVEAWLLYEIGGGKLPHFVKGSKEVAEWLKVKLLKAK